MAVVVVVFIVIAAVLTLFSPQKTFQAWIPCAGAPTAAVFMIAFGDNSASGTVSSFFTTNPARWPAPLSYQQATNDVCVHPKNFTTWDLTSAESLVWSSPLNAFESPSKHAQATMQRFTSLSTILLSLEAVVRQCLFPLTCHLSDPPSSP